MRNEPNPDFFDALLRVGGFAAAGFLVLILTSANSLDDVTRNALASFAAGLAANLFTVSKFERRRFSDFGLGWPPRHLFAGCAIGAGALGTIVGLATATGQAAFAPVTPDHSAAPLVPLLFAGALGEEMLFRGYAFQYLVRTWSGPATIAASGILFGLVHLANENVQPLGAANTALWGCLLGYAWVRGRSLWLPSGIHYGWNLALTLFTSNLSGTTIRATAWDLQWSAGDLWSGGSYGLEGGLFATLAALPVFLCIRRVR
jgi:membrane protease YdiL (CAAX protease family)